MRLWCRIVRELNLCYVLFVHIFTKWAHRTTERGIGFLIPIAFCQLLRFISSLYVLFIFSLGSVTTFLYLRKHF
jgi:hypothetical protein